MRAAALRLIGFRSVRAACGFTGALTHPLASSHAE